MCRIVTVAARVPGSVFTDLMRTGIIQDPYYRFNDVAYRHYCYLDWNYHKTFTGYLCLPVDIYYLPHVYYSMLCVMS